MASFARLVVLLLASVMGFSPVGVRELSRARIEQGPEQASRPDGESVVMNRSEKQRGVHRQRIATPGVDPASDSFGDDIAWQEPTRSDRLDAPLADPITMVDFAWHVPHGTSGAQSCRGPPMLA
ncbi:MAG TPA: hypothetical protein VG755_18825 [Nannocystaceae bacterium]|nr:hypothetical protein [Nannocystaceae bacterium]